MYLCLPLRLIDLDIYNHACSACCGMCSRLFHSRAQRQNAPNPLYLKAHSLSSSSTLLPHLPTQLSSNPASQFWCQALFSALGCKLPFILVFPSGMLVSSSGHWTVNNCKSQKFIYIFILSQIVLLAENEPPGLAL